MTRPDASSPIPRCTGVNRFGILLTNLLWLASCLRPYVRFKAALARPARYQRKALRTLMSRNRDTRYGREHRFDTVTDWGQFMALPLTRGEDYDGYVARIMQGEQQVLTRCPVDILQPTSGTSSSPKLIPYNDAVAAEFRNALDPWIVDLFLRFPGLLLGRQYWSISPATESMREQQSVVPVGFLDDMDYFGKARRWIMRRVLAVPADVRHIPETTANHYVTLLFLLRQRHLRLISVWHPSFLTILIDLLKSRWHHCLDDVRNGGIHASIDVPADLRRRISRQLRPDARRYRELSAIDVDSVTLAEAIWPRLLVISCWCDGNAATAVGDLRQRFPSATIQPKGLLATEGIVTLPFGREQAHVCAITSHVLEFMDEHGTVHPVWDLVAGATYRVILTTGGGHYRYQLGDRVKVTGHIGKTPCLRFLGRAGVVSDLVGEKVHLEHVEAILAELRQSFDLSGRFAMLAPSAKNGSSRYTLLLENSGESDSELEELATRLEELLGNNYHYRHARALHQLDPSTVTLVPAGASQRYRELMVAKGALASSVKFPALCMSPGIEECLDGHVTENGVQERDEMPMV